MTSLQKSFMEVPLKNLTEIYNNEVIPRLTKKNKVIAISAAIVLMVTYKLNDLLRPPRKLRHIPHQGYFSFLMSLFRKETVLERSQRYALPQIDSAESNGLYLVITIYIYM